MCEADVTYSVVEVDSPNNFTAVVSILNNRDAVMSHWQLVWTYDTFDHVILARTDGAISLTGGSPGGAPVRLVDTFTTEGIAGGSSYAFLTYGQFVPTDDYSNDSLLVSNVNLNGINCPRMSPAADASLVCTQDEDQDYSGGAAGTSATDGCKAIYCCGYVLSSSSPPAALDPADGPSASPVLSGNGTQGSTPLEQDGNVSAYDGPPQGPSPSKSTPSPSSGSSSPAPSPDQSTSGDGGGGVSLGMVIGVVTGVAVAVALLVVGGWVIVARRRAARQVAPRGAQNPDAKDEPLQRGSASSAGTSSTPGTPSIVPGTLSSPHAGSLGATLTVTSGATLTLPALQPSGGSGVVSSLDRGNSGISSAGLSPDSGLPRMASSDLVTQVVLHDQLGAGAFGVVYRAEWNGRPVAVKVLQMTCRSHSSRELESFKREVEVLSTLQHPHIVRFLGACTVPPNICIIEELAEGGSLHTRLHGKPGSRRRQPLPYGELLGIAAGIADAMVYLHPKVVHRDLKSQNVLLGADGRALVCDFGIAKFKDRTFVSTANGQAGTPAYMAPEMFDGVGVTEKVDVFAFGVLLWEMLTGDVPWCHVPSPMQIIYCVGVMGQRLPLPAACPAVLRSLIEACWAEEPAARPNFVTILHELRGEQSGLTQGALARPLPLPVAAESNTGSDDEEGPSSLGSGSRSPPAMASLSSSASLHLRAMQLKRGGQPSTSTESSPFASMRNEPFTAHSTGSGPASDWMTRGRDRIASAQPGDAALPAA